MRNDFTELLLPILVLSNGLWIVVCGIFAWLYLDASEESEFLWRRLFFFYRASSRLKHCSMKHGLKANRRRVSKDN